MRHTRIIFPAPGSIELDIIDPPSAGRLSLRVGVTVLPMVAPDPDKGEANVRYRHSLGDRLMDLYNQGRGGRRVTRAHGCP